MYATSQTHNATALASYFTGKLREEFKLESKVRSAHGTRIPLWHFIYDDDSRTLCVLSLV
jgi:hypothetical protein